MTLQLTQEQAMRLRNIRAFRYIQIDNLNLKRKREQNIEKRKLRDNKIITLLHSGKSTGEIATECECSTETVRTVKNRVFGIGEQKKARNRQIINLLIRGDRIAHIAETCEVSHWTVYTARRRLRSAGIETSMFDHGYVDRGDVNMHRFSESTTAMEV